MKSFQQRKPRFLLNAHMVILSHIEFVFVYKSSSFCSERNLHQMDFQIWFTQGFLKQEVPPVSFTFPCCSFTLGESGFVFLSILV